MNIEIKFNTNFLRSLSQLQQLITGDEDYKEAAGLALVAWKDVFNADPATYAAADLYYATVAGDFQRLAGRDEKLLQDRPGFFHQLYRLDPEIKAHPARAYLEVLTNAEDRGNVWDALTDLYRTSIILRIYSRLPAVQKLIRILLESKLASRKGSSIMDMLQGMKHKHQMRSLVNEMMDCDDSVMNELLDLVHRILTTFNEGDTKHDTTGLTEALRNLNFQQDPTHLLESMLEKVQNDPVISGQFKDATEALGLGNLSEMIQEWKDGNPVDLPAPLTKALGV